MRRRTALVLLLLMLLPVRGRALEEYATRTGLPCAECHVDPGGGGPLTPTGEAFARGGHIWPLSERATGADGGGRLPGFLRFTLGFVHLLSAFLWVGTIFYVHIVLRPRYAIGGLPKAEMRIAWGAMALLAATGVPLTRMRFHHPAALLETRSGILLLVKIGLFLFLVCSAAYVSLFLSRTLKNRRENWQQNDGLEGRPAWVKVGDRLFDLTGSRRWEHGVHFGRHHAGADMTKALEGAPHGIEKLQSFPSFSLVDKGLAKENRAVATLFFLAYTNLFVALGIVFIIALWRWG